MTPVCPLCDPGLITRRSLVQIQPPQLELLSTRSLLRTTERSKAPDASYQRPEPLILGVCPEVPCPILDRRRWFSALGPGADPAGALVAARSSHLGVLLPRLGEVVVGQV